ncbi:hypothetical protein DWX73_07895 [Coprococcus sp. AF21-14LB]|nr:hypothetical protein DWX73_07895 [Coprococcus sp. AF21-14LB]
MKNLRLEVCGTFHKEERGYIAYRDAASGAVYNERKEKCVRQKKDINSRKISFPFACILLPHMEQKEAATAEKEEVKWSQPALNGI